MSERANDLAAATRGLAKDLWWAVLLRGIAAILFGILALVWPGATVLALVVVFAIYAISDGIFDIVRAIQVRHTVDTWIWWLLGGIASVIAGAVAAFWPGITAVAAAIVIGAWAFVTGILEIFGALRLRRQGVDHWGWLVASGALSVLVGVLFGLFPGEGLLSLLWLLGFYAIALGVFLVIAALRARKALTGSVDTLTAP